MRFQSSAEVPVPRRMLLADRRRLVGSLAAVGLALMLILLLDGLSTGVDARVTVYERNAGASLYVAQEGTASLLGSISVIPADIEQRVAALPGVAWAAPMRGFFTVPMIGGARVPAYIVGWQPGRQGGPWNVASGRAPTSNDEIIVGGEIARRGSLVPGSNFELLGQTFKVVGVAGDADMFMASFVFMTHQATDTLLHSPGTTSFILVGTDQPAAVADRLRAQGVHAVPRETIERNDLAIKGQAYSTALSLVVAVAFVAGALVIASTLYSSIVERRREYGIIKALGANSRRVYRMVLTQSIVLAVGGLVVGFAFFVMGVAVLARVRPQFAIAPTTGAVVRAVVASLVMGAVATIVPARRLDAMEPAIAFGGA